MDDRSIASTSSPPEMSNDLSLSETRNDSVQVSEENKLSTSNQNSMMVVVLDYFKRQTLYGSRFWDLHPFITLLNKTKTFCKSLSHLESADEVFKRLFAYFFYHILPITQIDRICQQYLPVRIVRNSPSMNEMITSYLSKFYEDRLAKIRTKVHQFDGNIYLAFTTEELELGNLITLRKSTSKNETQFGFFLFIMVGTISPNPKKYLLKTVRLLENQSDTIMDKLFEDIFMDALKLLWPNGDHLSRAAAQLKHIIADGDLLFDDIVRNLANRYSELSRLVLAQNAHLLMHSIEGEIRQKHQTVCNVIDVVRMQWATSEAFRTKYKRLSSETATPPASFFRSAAFYKAHFSEAQKGILSWRSFLFDDTGVSSTLSNMQFGPAFDKFAESAALLEAIERASTADVHLFSIQVADLFHAFLQFYQEIFQHKDHVSLKSYADWFEEKTRSIIGGSEAEKNILTGGEYQLLKRLFGEIFNRSCHNAPLSKCRLTKYFMIRCVHTGTFCIPATLEEANLPLEPLDSSQLRRSFPRFWFLFKKYEVPLPWSLMNECSLLYAWAEANDHWTLDSSQLDKIAL